MKKTSTYICLGVFCLIAACKKDFLVLAPRSETNAANFFKTAEDYNNAVVSVYAKLQSIPDTYFEMTGYRSDELNISAPTSGTQDRYNIDKFADKPSNTIILTAWTLYYTTISRCNEITNRINASALNDNIKTQYNAEARFIRAYMYFDLVRFWGDVPLVLSPLSPADALLTGRTEKAKVLAAVEDDLKYAAQNLPASFTGNDLGRATSGAAKALLAKVYLWQKKYQDVKSVLEPMLNSYQLISPVKNVFDAANKMNAEVIFAIRFNKDITGEGHALWFQTTDTGTTNPVTRSLAAKYANTDQRRDLLRFTRQGAVFGLNKFYDVLSSTTRNAGNDYILLRHADVLLMYAEAVNEISYAAGGPAFDNLNRVRTRAGISAYTAADLSSQQSFRAAVWLERRLEFPLEAQRWFDLLRTDAMITEMAANENVKAMPYSTLFPIPQSEYEKIGNPAIFPQNLGY